MIIPLQPGSPDLHRLLAQVREIEDLSFPHPWTDQNFLDEGSQPTGFLDLLCQRSHGPHSLVVRAFSCCRLLHDELHILQIATHPDLRRQGHGAELLCHVLGTAGRRGAVSLVLEVRSSNRAARNLYEKHGFRQVGLRRGYYADNGEDAVVMTCPVHPEATSC